MCANVGGVAADAILAREIYVNSRPKCFGAMAFETDAYGPYFSCLNCGHQCELVKVSPILLQKDIRANPWRRIEAAPVAREKRGHEKGCSHNLAGKTLAVRLNSGTQLRYVGRDSDGSYTTTYTTNQRRVFGGTSPGRHQQLGRLVGRYISRDWWLFEYADARRFF